MKRIYLIITLCSLTLSSVLSASFQVLQLDPNGGTNTMPAHNLIYDIAASAVITPPMRAGYTFTGWTGTGTKYLGQQNVTVVAEETTFDGTSTYFDLGRTYMYTDKITVNLWAYMDNWGEYVTGEMRLISCTQGGGWNFEASADGYIRFACHDGSGYRSALSSTLWSSLAAGWHMFTLTADGRNVYGYVDGVLLASGDILTTGKIGYHASNSILVGAEASATAAPDNGFFKGKMKDLTIVNAFISANEVANMYSTIQVVGEENAKVVRYYVPNSNVSLKASWKENAATTLTLDANGGKNTMAQDSYSQAAGTSLKVTNPTHTNAIFKHWEPTSAQYISNYQGIPCSSPEEVTFNGTSTYYALGREYMYTDVLTLNIWGYMDNWNDYKTADMRMISCTQTGGWNIESAGEQIRFAIRDAGKTDSYNSIITKKNWSDLSKGWHMFTLVFDGTRAYGYIDGVLVGKSAPFAGGIQYNSSNSILIGAEPATGNTPANTACYFKGKIKNLAIMHTAITPEDVVALYATPNETRFFFPTKNHTLKAVWEQSSTPTITTSATELTFETTEGTVAAKQTITVGAANLSSNITATLSGTNAQAFTISPASLEETGGNITVTYTETTVGSHNATLTLSATGANSQTITLKGVVNAKAVNPEPTTSPLVADKMSITLEGVYGATNAPYEDVKITGTDLTSDITYNSVSSVITVTALEGWDVRKGGTLRLTLNTNFTLGAGEYDKYVGVQSGKDIRIEIQTKAILKKAGTTTNIEATNKDNWGYYTAEEILYVTGIDAQEIALYNVGGQMVGNIVGQNQMTISGLKGVYLINVTDKTGKVHTGKIIIK